MKIRAFEDKYVIQKLNEQSIEYLLLNQILYALTKTKFYKAKNQRNNSTSLMYYLFYKSLPQNHI